MITERLKGEWAGQAIEFKTELFGRDYYWMRDLDSTIYLAKVGVNGNPDLS
jgi:hypothetical protein